LQEKEAANAKLTATLVAQNQAIDNYVKQLEVEAKKRELLSQQLDAEVSPTVVCA
jgi:hypothetical protein